MPYTLTSLGAYLAQAKRTMPVVATTALIMPTKGQITRDIVYWSASLRAEHPTLHALGYRAVALVSTAYVVAVVPFSWLPRLPLPEARALALPKEPLPSPSAANTAFSITMDARGFHVSSTPVAVSRSVQHDELTHAPYDPKTFTASGEEIRRLYERSDGEVEWWRSRYYIPESVGVKLDVSSDLKQVRILQGGRRAFPNDINYYRHIVVNESSLRVVKGTGRSVPRKSYFYVLEELFRIFATDVEDFNQRFLLRYVEDSNLLTVLERPSGLLVGLIPGNDVIEE